MNNNQFVSIYSLILSSLSFMFYINIIQYFELGDLGVFFWAFLSVFFFVISFINFLKGIKQE